MPNATNAASHTAALMPVMRPPAIARVAGTALATQVTMPATMSQRLGSMPVIVWGRAGGEVSAGVRVLRTKKRTEAHTHPWDIGLSSLLTLTSVAMMVYGLVTGTFLFAGFSVIGLVSGVQGLYYWLRKPADRMHWWFRH